MVGVNQSRRGINAKIDRALDGAKLLGKNDDGEVCVWFGGYSLNVYDAARDWDEIRHFTSGQIMALSEKDSTEGRAYAKERMKSEGFEPIC